MTILTPERLAEIKGRLAFDDERGVTHPHAETLRRLLASHAALQAEVERLRGHLDKRNEEYLTMNSHAADLQDELTTVRESAADADELVRLAEAYVQAVSPIRLRGQDQGAERMSKLRDRCKAMYEKMTRDAILRQGSPVDDLLGFVVAEIGRSADASLESALPVVLYFGSDADRDEFVALVHEAKPGMIAKRFP